jgi:hypothetical protein
MQGVFRAASTAITNNRCHRKMNCPPQNEHHRNMNTATAT